ncbi:MAG: HAD family hydrolase [Ruminococcus sp.]|nr:HAD family hydrolase [Ruminococcus sp.]
MKYNTYLFDLDGTLTDSGLGIINGVKYSLEKSGDEIPPQNTLLKFIGPPLWESFESFLGFSKEKAETAVKYYREYYRETGLFENAVYEGIPELLKKLKNSGKQLAVATSKPEPFSVRILEHFGLAEYFGSITGSDLDGTRIEKSEVVACALERCGVTDKSSAVMVGDRKHDIIGAHANGLECMYVMYGYGNIDEAREHNAEYIVNSPMEIADI